MTTTTIPVCESCTHLQPNPDGSGTLVCAAFPDGVPDAIYVDGFDHRQPFDGDGGVRWALSNEPGAAARLAVYDQDHT